MISDLVVAPFHLSFTANHDNGRIKGNCNAMTDIEHHMILTVFFVLYGLSESLERTSVPIMQHIKKRFRGIN